MISLLNLMESLPRRVEAVIWTTNFHIKDNILISFRTGSMCVQIAAASCLLNYFFSSLVLYFLSFASQLALNSHAFL